MVETEPKRDEADRLTRANAPADRSPCALLLLLFSIDPLVGRSRVRALDYFI